MTARKVPVRDGVAERLTTNADGHSLWFYKTEHVAPTREAGFFNGHPPLKAGDIVVVQAPDGTALVPIRVTITPEDKP